jgi:hypothetical protein
MFESIRPSALVFVAATIAVVPCTALAQGQTEPPTVRDNCVKVEPGKGAEFEAYLKDVTVPLARSRAESGEFAWFLVASSVVPAGSSAPCDYRIVYGYKGLPAEPLSNDALAAAVKRAKLPMTADQMLAKRNALSHLVKVEIWSQVDGIGPDTEKDNYVRLNHYQVKQGEFSEWLRLEKSIWKPLMEAWLKAGGKGAWSVNALEMPGGDSTPYNGLTVDLFPDWTGLMHGVPANQLWTKVHPDVDITAAFNRLDKVRSIHDVEVYKVVDIVKAK